MTLPAEKELEVRPSPTQYEFIMDESPEVCLMGPRGEGKTEAGIMAITYFSTLQAEEFRPLPGALIRDTWENLKRTAVESFLRPRPGSFAHSIRDYLIIREGGKYIEFPGYWFLWLFGADEPRDLNKLQSLQLAILWLEEAAPAAVEDIGSGVQEDVFNIGITSLRAPTTTPWRRAQITMNYPAEDHWTWQRFYEFADENTGLHQILRGENRFIDETYRKQMERALRHRPDLKARLVEGRPTAVQLGEKVTPSYNPKVHRSSFRLDPIPGAQGVRFWDGGHHPTCLIGQITPRGQLQILDTFRGEQEGMEQLITKAGGVKEMLNSPRYKNEKDQYKIQTWRDIGDHTIRTPEQANIYSSGAMVINRELGASFEPGPKGPNSWNIMKETLDQIFHRMVGAGEPLVLVSKHEQILHRALAGGWHYKKLPTGRVIEKKPVKDIHSHPGDALANGLARLYPVMGKKKGRKKSTVQLRKRGRSYGTK